MRGQCSSRRRLAGVRRRRSSQAPSGISSRPNDEDAGQDQEEDDAEVRVGVQPEQIGEEDDQEQRPR